MINTGTHDGLKTLSSIRKGGTMATKHISSKAITLGILGSMFLPIAHNAEADFIGDEVTLTLDIAGDKATKTPIATSPGISWFDYPSDFSTSAAPPNTGYGYVSTYFYGTDFRFNFGVFDFTESFDMTLTVSDIDWTTDAVPHEIVGVSNSYGNATSITTGANFVSIDFSVPYPAGANDSAFTAVSGFDLVWAAAEPIPEPSTLTLLGIALGGLAFRRNYKKRKQ
jgi:hypothetical protein